MKPESMYKVTFFNDRPPTTYYLADRYMKEQDAVLFFLDEKEFMILGVDEIEVVEYDQDLYTSQWNAVDVKLDN